MATTARFKTQCAWCEQTIDRGQQMAVAKREDGRTHWQHFPHCPPETAYRLPVEWKPDTEDLSTIRPDAEYL